MLFKKTKLPGTYIIKIEKKKDKRGFFARSYCQEELKKIGISFSIVQSNISYNKTKGTLRGMHYQAAPYEEAKIVSCVQGALYDVIIDLRVASPTFGNWFALELSAQNYVSLYIPKGFAHGFQTLEDDTVVLYQMSEFYHPGSARGVRWDDPAFQITWPLSRVIISARDSSFALTSSR